MYCKYCAENSPIKLKQQLNTMRAVYIYTVVKYFVGFINKCGESCQDMDFLARRNYIFLDIYALLFWALD
jgi:hypothetical protein